MEEWSYQDRNYHRFTEDEDYEDVSFEDDSDRGCKDCPEDACDGHCFNCYYRPIQEEFSMKKVLMREISMDEVLRLTNGLKKRVKMTNGKEYRLIRATPTGAYYEFDELLKDLEGNLYGISGELCFPVVEEQ